MAFVITEACIGVKDMSCVAVCPVDCIITSDADPFMLINPDECIDCGACMPECPVNAIFAEDDVPADQQQWKEINKGYASLDKAAFNEKYGKIIEAAKEKNRGTAHANPALY